MVLTIFATFLFQTTENLASAFGISFLTIVCITTLLIVWATIENEKKFHLHTRIFIIFVMIIVFPIELIYLAANYVKFATGGWIILVIGTFIFCLQMIWTICENYVWHLKNKNKIVELKSLRTSLVDRKIIRQIHGLGVFINQTNNQYDQKGVAPYVFQFMESIQGSFEKMLFLTVKKLSVSIVHPDEKYVYIHHGEEVYSLTIYVGFYEKEPDISKEVQKFDSRSQSEITFIAPRERIVVDRRARFFWKIPIQVYHFLFVNSTHSPVHRLPKNCIEVCYRLKLPSSRESDVDLEERKKE
jgi:K+ transporter